MKQSLLQTGKPKGTYKCGDSHPKHPKYSYFSWVTKKNCERWVKKEVAEKQLKNNAEKQKQGKIERDKKNQELRFPRLKQKELQTGKPKGTYKKGEKHPVHANLVFVKWSNRTSNKELWTRKEQYEINNRNKNEYQKNQRKENPEETLAKDAERRERDSERINERGRERHARLKGDPHYEEQQKKHRKNHAPKRAIREKKRRQNPEVRARNRATDKLRLENDPNARIAKTFRNRIYMALKHFGGKKSKSSIELLGCDIKTARKHLESQWKEGMNWDNYGQPEDDYFAGWHVDHIIPCVKFDLTKEEEQLKCFNYTNLQPLWAKDNLSKWANEDVGK